MIDSYIQTEKVTASLFKIVNIWTTKTKWSIPEAYRAGSCIFCSGSRYIKTDKVAIKTASLSKIVDIWTTKTKWSIPEAYRAGSGMSGSV